MQWLFLTSLEVELSKLVRFFAADWPFFLNNYIVQKWKLDLDQNLSTPERPLPCVLLANKIDLAKEHLDKEKMEAYIKEHNFIAW